MDRYPDGGMYSIKLVHPQHLNHPFFTRDTHHDGRQRWMNFSNQGNTPALARSIREGHKALVYVTRPIMKFVWAVEYRGPAQDGQQLAAEWSAPANTLQADWSNLLLPIRFLATIDDVDSAPDAQVVLQQAGAAFTPNAFPMKHISAAEYQRIFAAINWQWPG